VSKTGRLAAALLADRERPTIHHTADHDEWLAGSFRTALRLTRARQSTPCRRHYRIEDGIDEAVVEDDPVGPFAS
jgi:hypothetical protein